MCFLQNIHYLQKKQFYMEKKIYINFFLFTEKGFFTENEKKYISHLRNIFLFRKYIFILQKKNF